MSDAEVLAEIVLILSKGDDFRPRMPVKDVTLATRFKEDLGFDSLALMSLVFELQEKHPALDEMSIGKWKTVEDCVRCTLGSD